MLFSSLKFLITFSLIAFGSHAPAAAQALLEIVLCVAIAEYFAVGRGRVELAEAAVVRLQRVLANTGFQLAAEMFSPLAAIRRNSALLVEVIYTTLIGKHHCVYAALLTAVFR